MPNSKQAKPSATVRQEPLSASKKKQLSALASRVTSPATTKLDPAVRYTIYKIEQHLQQLEEFGVITEHEGADLLIKAIEDRGLTLADYLEGHWTRK